MLTREHAIAELDFRAREVVPDRLLARTHGHYVAYADEALRIYQNAAGRRRRDIHQNIETIFADDPFYHPRRVQAFCKLLDDKSSYDKDRERNSAKLRGEVFLLAGREHPLTSRADTLFDHPEQEVKDAIAVAYQQSWQQIEDKLFDDVLSFNRLTAFDSSVYSDARALLARYNVAQFQVALFDALRMRIHAKVHLKSILRFAKLAQLMHTVRRNKDGTFLIVLDGPVSVLDDSRRYGVNMARFLPGLLSCNGWTLDADIKHSKAGVFHLHLSPNSGLHVPVQPPSEFDSDVEKAFAEKWGHEPRNGWSLERESEPLIRGQNVFFPDFVFRHESGKAVLAEIIGYWTREYIEEKRRTLERFHDEQLLLILRESAAAQFADLPFAVVTYKTAIKLEPILQALGIVGSR